MKLKIEVRSWNNYLPPPPPPPHTPWDGEGAY